MESRRKRLRSDELQDPELFSLPNKLPKVEGLHSDSLLSKRPKQLWRLKVPDCDPQNNSPLFSTISPEIRNQIFDLVFRLEIHLTDEEAVIAKLKGKGATLWGDEERSSCTLSPELLRTCRLAYVEWRRLPVWNWDHEFFGSCSRWNDDGRLRHRRFRDLPLYGLGKNEVKEPYRRWTCGTSLISYSQMPARTKAQIQKVSVYDIKPSAFSYGYNFFGMTTIRPRKVFVAASLQQYTRYTEQFIPSIDNMSGWHAELEELTLRIDARSKDKEWLKNNGLVYQETKKFGGGVLKLVDGKRGMLGTWKGLDLRGKHVEWHSVTNVWKDSSLL